MQEVEAICDRVIIINKGEIVANDETKNLQKNTTKQIITVEFINSYDLTKKQKEEVTKQLKTLNKFNFFVSPTQKGEFTYKVFYRP